MRKHFTSVLTMAAISLLTSALIVPALALQPAASPAPEAPPAATAPVVVHEALTAVPQSSPAAAFTPAPAAKAPAVKKAAAKKVTKKAAKRTTKKAAKRVAKKKVRKAKAATAFSSSANDLDTAQSVLASLKGQYRYLDGVTVTIGKTPGGYQAVSYYTAGRIVIRSTHTASIQRILAHEIWHIIDWRDNGHIDWSESVPPQNAADYRK